MKSLGKWWRGRSCTCRRCGEVFVLEDADRPHTSDRYAAAVACPTCGQECAVDKRWHEVVPREEEGCATRD